MVLLMDDMVLVVVAGKEYMVMPATAAIAEAVLTDDPHTFVRVE